MWFSQNISSIVGILCYYGGKTIDSNNCIIYHVGSTKLYNLRLDSSFDEFKNLVCQGIEWDLTEFDVDINLRMLGDGHPSRYRGVPITSDMSFNAMVGLIIANELQY